MKLILSTSNIIVGGPPIIRRSASKSNTELTSSLRANFNSHIASDEPPSHGGQPSFRSWTSQEGRNFYIPALSFDNGLQEERSAYDITVKLFFLPDIPSSRRCQHTEEAIGLVLKELGVENIDLLIISFPGIAVDADDESEEDEMEPTGGTTLAASDLTSGGGGVEDVKSMVQTWRTLEKLHDSGVIAKLGLAEFGTRRLNKFLPTTRVRPSVDQINVRDCCVVPKPLIMFAKRESIELLTHNDCTNILPRGTLRELLGPAEAGGVGLLTAPGGSAPEPGSEALAGDVEPQWVVKYTAVVKDRGVVENKGYFAVAELNSTSSS